MLKSLRTQRRYTAEYVAERLVVSPSKVSRLETGQRGASERDINDLCDLYEVDDQQRERLLELANEGRQRPWWLPLRLPYSHYVGLEADAISISDFGLGIIPGLLQTADYARAVVLAAVPRPEPGIVEQSLRGRMERQRLLRAESAPHFGAVMDESVLHRVVGSREVMRDQLRRLLELSELPNVTLRVFLNDAGALPTANKFIILRFASPDVKDTVYVEGLTNDSYLDDPGEVETYDRTFRTMAGLAASPDETPGIIAAMIPRYGG